MARTSFANEIIANYKKIIKVLCDNKLIRRYNELSEKNSGHKKIIEYCSKNEFSKYLYDSTISASDLYSFLYQENQFNIEFADGSILLFECIIEGKNIIKQRIVFIKIFDNLATIEDTENSWEYYQSNEEEKNQLSFPILLRVDYNANEQKLDHPISHLTISNIENCRIPITANWGFDRFIEFVLQEFFHRYDISFDKINFASTIREEEKKRIHINWEK